MIDANTRQALREAALEVWRKGDRFTPQFSDASGIHPLILLNLLDDMNGIVKELEALTPGGSEFHDDPVMCLAYLKGRMSGVVKMQQTIKNLQMLLYEQNNPPGIAERIFE